MLLLPILINQLKNSREKNIHIRNWINKLNIDIDKINHVSDIPLLPVQMFKYFDLRTSNDIFLILKSSGTTGDNQSLVPINRSTSIRQRKALTSILKNYIGNKRYPMLIVDASASNKSGTELTARGAAIRGLSQFSKDNCYLFDDVDGNLVINYERFRNFSGKYKNKKILIIGFTFILWKKLIEENLQLKDEITFKDSMILHGGGWKKMRNLMITKNEFNNKISIFFGTNLTNVIDYYGMVEQLGIIFLDCEYGYKHIPNFADIIIRNYYSLRENDFGETGYIEILNALSDSYPGMSLLTEDTGKLIGIDDCKCGRLGKYFQFESRVEKAEARGCGDTFREKNACTY